MTSHASYLLVISDREALGWILANSRTAFPGMRREVRLLREGDMLYLHTTRGCFKNPTRDRSRVIGTAVVDSCVGALVDPPTFGDRTFPVGCRLRIGPIAPLHEGVDLAPIASRMDAFATLGKNWSFGLRRALVALSERDSAALEDLLRGVVNNEKETKEPYLHWYSRRSITRLEGP